jgi:hypothetical protein
LYLTMHHGASWLTAIMIALSLIPGFYAALSGSMLEIAPKLHQDIYPLQKNQMLVAVGRLLLNLSCLFFYPLASLAIFATGLSRAYGNVRLKGVVAHYTSNNAKKDPEVKREVRGVVKKVMPSAIYFAISSQLTIWLVSIFGNTIVIAQLGALGRFAVAYALLNTLINILIIPRFARLNANSNQIPIMLYKTMLITVTVSVVSIFVFYKFDSLLLKILGDKYQDLTSELVLIAVSSSLGLISGALNALLSSRAIIIPPRWFITGVISIQSAGLFLFEIGELKGVIEYSIATTLVIISMRLIYFQIYLFRSR